MGVIPINFRGKTAQNKAKAKGKGKHKKKPVPPRNGNKKDVLGFLAGGPGARGQNTQQGDSEPDPQDPMEEQENEAGEV